MIEDFSLRLLMVKRSSRQKQRSILLGVYRVRTSAAHILNWGYPEGRFCKITSQRNSTSAVGNWSSILLETLNSCTEQALELSHHRTEKMGHLSIDFCPPLVERCPSSLGH